MAKQAKTEDADVIDPDVADDQDVQDEVPQEEPTAPGVAEEDDADEALEATLKAKEARLRADAAETAAEHKRLKNLRKKRGGQAEPDPFAGTIFAKNIQAKVAKALVSRQICLCEEHAGAKRGKVVTLLAEEFPGDRETLEQAVATNYGPGCYRVQGYGEHGAFVGGGNWSFAVPGEPWEFDVSSPTAVKKRREEEENAAGGIDIIPSNVQPIPGVRGPGGKIYFQAKPEESDGTSEVEALRAEIAELRRGNPDSQGFTQMLQALHETSQAAATAQHAQFTQLMTMMESKSNAVTKQLSEMATGLVTATQEMARASIASAERSAKAQVDAAQKLADSQMAFVEKQIARDADREKKPLEMMAEAQSQASKILNESVASALKNAGEIQKSAMTALIEQIGGDDTVVGQLAKYGVLDVAKNALGKLAGVAPEQAESEEKEAPKQLPAPQPEQPAAELPYAHPQLGQYIAQAVQRGHEPAAFAQQAEAQLLSPTAVLDLEAIASDAGLKPGEKIEKFLAAFKSVLGPQVAAMARTQQGRPWIFGFVSAFETENEGVEQAAEATPSANEAPQAPSAPPTADGVV